MTWLLMVIILNLEVSPPEVSETKILAMYETEKECIEKHKAFFQGLKKQKIPVPNNFNLGCVPQKGKRL